MKIACPCGHTIADQTDMLPYMAHVLADQDLGDFLELLQKAEPPEVVGIHFHITRSMYQCTSCGRICLESPVSRQLQWFLPEGEADRQPVLGSIEGRRWKTPLIGTWLDWKREGELVWMQSGDLPGGCEKLDNFEELARRYHEVLRTLESQGRLRTASLHRGDQLVHGWPGAGETEGGP